MGFKISSSDGRPITAKRIGEALGDTVAWLIGVGLTWITGFGPLTFSLAKPFNEGEYDQDEMFQFTLGRGF